MRPTGPWGPPRPMGGVIWGGARPWGTPEVRSVPFFCLYAYMIIKRYSRNVEYSNISGRSPGEIPPWGWAPPKPLRPPQGPPGVLEIWKKL